MKKVLELEALQKKVNDQIDSQGEANHADADRLDEMYDELTPEEESLLISRYNYRYEIEEELKYDRWVIEQAFNQDK